MTKTACTQQLEPDAEIGKLLVDNDAAVLQTIFTRAIAINSLAEFQQVLDEVVPGE